MDSDAIFLRPIEAARMLAISRTRVYELLNAGQLAGVRIGGGAWRIPRDAIEKLAQDAIAATNCER